MFILCAFRSGASQGSVDCESETWRRACFASRGFAGTGARLETRCGLSLFIYLKKKHHAPCHTLPEEARRHTLGPGSYDSLTSEDGLLYA